MRSQRQVSTQRPLQRQVSLYVRQYVAANDSALLSIEWLPGNKRDTSLNAFRVTTQWHGLRAPQSKAPPGNKNPAADQRREFVVSTETPRSGYPPGRTHYCECIHSIYYENVLYDGISRCARDFAKCPGGRSLHLSRRNGF
jgi:hypothetical protein